MQSGLAILVQLLKVGSAAMFFLSALPLFVVLLINPLFSGNIKTISLATYFLGQICPLLTGSLLTIPTIEVFVPLVSVSLLSLHLLFTMLVIDGSRRRSSPSGQHDRLTRQRPRRAVPSLGVAPCT
jgi:hypothetical protein